MLFGLIRKKISQDEIVDRFIHDMFIGGRGEWDDIAAVVYVRNGGDAHTPVNWPELKYDQATADRVGYVAIAFHLQELSRFLKPKEILVVRNALLERLSKAPDNMLRTLDKDFGAARFLNCLDLSTVGKALAKATGLDSIILARGGNLADEITIRTLGAIVADLGRGWWKRLFRKYRLKVEPGFDEKQLSQDETVDNQLPTVEIIAPSHSPHVSLFHGATAESIVFTHKSIQDSYTRYLAGNALPPDTCNINIDNGFPRFLEVLRTGVALTGFDSPYIIWYAMNDSQLMIYFMGESERMEEIPESLLDFIVDRFPMYDYGRTPVPEDAVPLMAWRPDDTILQLWNYSFSLPDCAALVLKSAQSVLSYKDVPSHAEETLIVEGKRFSLLHAHYEILDAA